jgi:hypothetical protein
MNKAVVPSLLLAGLLAAGLAQAQGSAAGTTPNLVAPEVTPVNKDALRREAQGGDRASATTKVPGRAGEATTMVNGQPNADPLAPQVGKSRAELRAERDMKKAQRRADRDARKMGAPAAAPAVVEGATPKQ